MKQITLLITATLLSTLVCARQQKAKPRARQGVTVSKTQAPAKKKTEAAPAIDPAPPVAGSSEVYPANGSLERMPEFTGGQQGLYRYLSSRLTYPAQAVEADIQGKVMVQFTVCEDGSLCDEKITKSLGGGCDEEALRVIKQMPKWQPGIKDGKPVKVRYVLPVMFQLQN